MWNQKVSDSIVRTGALIVCTDTWQKSLHFLFISNFLPYWEPAWSQFLISLTVTRLKLTPKSTEFGATFLILHILYNWRYDAPNFDKIILKDWHFEKSIDQNIFKSKAQLFWERHKSLSNLSHSLDISWTLEANIFSQNCPWICYLDES